MIVLFVGDQSYHGFKSIGKSVSLVTLHGRKICTPQRRFTGHSAISPVIRYPAATQPAT